MYRDTLPIGATYFGDPPVPLVVLWWWHVPRVGDSLHLRGDGEAPAVIGEVTGVIWHDAFVEVEIAVPDE